MDGLFTDLFLLLILSINQLFFYFIFNVALSKADSSSELISFNH